MKKSKKATSIVEAMVILMVITTGVVGTFTIYNNSRKLSDTTKNRIEAIEIAKEGIEAMKNLRDTNYLVFGSDTTNCWNTLNYNNNCIGDNTTSYDILSGSYIIYRDTDNRWKILPKTTGLYSNSTYRTDFRVKKDTNGFYTQSGGTDFLPIFTREIKINYTFSDSNQPKMAIKSIVQWSDNSGTHKVDLNLELNNRK